MKLNFSTISIWLIAISCVAINFSINKFERPQEVVKDDVVNYYEYLPLLFIYDDIRIEKKYEINGYNGQMIWAEQTSDGKNVIKMTMGLAILYSPFFFMAHVLAPVFNFPSDGYSLPYTIMLLLSSIIYLTIGLNFLKKILRHFQFSENIIAITILLIGLGTNLLCYASQSAPMPHVYLFCLVAIFFFYTIQWHQSPSINSSMALGFICGLITLTRPSDIVVVFLFLFYGISNFADISSRVIIYKKNFTLLLLIIGLSFLIWVPQFIYWKITTGHFLYYSYNDERFFFTHPRIIEGLLSFRKGWLIYTPMMLFALAGLFFLRGELKKQQKNFALFLLINFFVTFSWWCWWYGGSFGQRSMIDCYAILAIPFAATVNFVSARTGFVKIGFTLITLFLIWLNIFQTYQFEFKSLHYDGMNRKLYFMVFGKLHRNPEYERYATSIDYREAKLGRNSLYEIAPPAASFIGEDSVIIQSITGKYVSLNLNENKISLYSSNETPGEKETFILKKLPNNQFAITASNKLYLSTNLAKYGEVTASEKEMRLWETFTLTDLPNEFFAIKAANGKFISAEKNSLQLSAKSDVIGDSESFRFFNTRPQGDHGIKR